MTFEGYAEGEVTHDAVQAFKRQLGLAPEAMRSEIHMTDLRVMEVDQDKDSLRPDLDTLHAEWPGPGKQVNTMDMSVEDTPT
jgi:hypothetical protein